MPSALDGGEWLASHVGKRKLQVRDDVQYHNINVTLHQDSTAMPYLKQEEGQTDMVCHI
jgi:hypothetical protein